MLSFLTLDTGLQIVYKGLNELTVELIRRELKNILIL